MQLAHGKCRPGLMCPDAHSSCEGDIVHTDSSVEYQYSVNWRVCTFVIVATWPTACCGAATAMGAWCPKADCQCFHSASASSHTCCCILKTHAMDTPLETHTRDLRPIWCCCHNTYGTLPSRHPVQGAFAFANLPVVFETTAEFDESKNPLC
jgi:hypothetical protein